MPRYKLTIEYDGGPFTGWQSQAGGSSVQDVIERAVAVINGGPSSVHGAGRTDAGVHALAQVAHVDLARVWRADKLRDALNAHLKPAPVAAVETPTVSEPIPEAPPVTITVSPSRSRPATTSRAVECRSNADVMSPGMETSGGGFQSTSQRGLTGRP